MVANFSGLLAIATIAIASVAAQAPTSNLLNGACVTNYDASVDYFPQKLNTAEDKATFFTIEYHNNYKTVINHRSGVSYTLVQCGTPAPANADNSTRVREIPVTKVAAMETTAVPYLELLGVGNSIKLIADGSLISSSCFQKYLASGDITQLSATNETLQAQQIAAIQVQFGTNPYEPYDTNSSVSTSSAYEPDVLGRASWISYYAAFYNMEATANELSQKMIDNYNRLKTAASGYSKKPVVAWTEYDAPSQYNNNTGSYNLKNDSFKVGLTNDAGAAMVNTEKATYKTSAELLAALTNVDILIDETYIGPEMKDFMKNYGLSEADQSKYKFLANKKVFREDGIMTESGGYDWFEAPVAMADALLEDMINVVNKDAPSSQFNRNWLRNIATTESIKYTTVNNCTWTENAPRPDMATEFNGGAFTLADDSSSSAATITRTNIMAIVVSIASFIYLA